jgi:hypothetical protein
MRNLYPYHIQQIHLFLKIKKLHHHHIGRHISLRRVNSKALFCSLRTLAATGDEDVSESIYEP